MSNKNAQAALPILGPWQKIQAAMLHYYSSVEYLKPLYQMVTSLIDNVADPAIELAAIQGRDAGLISKQWGNRDTAQNWSNNAWPFLKDLQVSLAGDIAARSNGEYRMTSVMDKLRGIAEYSTAWTTSQEKARLNRELELISNYSIPHDKTCREYHNAWTDSSFTSYYLEFSSTQIQIPKFRIRNDVTACTGEIPPLTGVYIAHGDPNATLQFVWVTGRGAELRPANTFNKLGLAALEEVGRDDLWINDQKMFRFAMADKYKEKFRAKLTYGNSEWPSAAAGMVAMEAFLSVACKWSLVEIIPGQMETLKSLNDEPLTTESGRLRIVGGSLCTISGFYFTPSITHSRRFFKAGEFTPNISSSYGKVYWQWDDNQCEGA